ncbi:class I SAM-dependent methyltransferase [Alicyclobacillaceae bacterium I2511]|nr:class I SAM-dependent methyltransferase [Alicyclobacillaceae bacterium I2511]
MSRPTQISVVARGISLQLWTNAGVFSKRGLDFGTRVLIEAVNLPESGLLVDLGCGYGAAAAILGRVYPQTQWVLLDVNPRAIELAARNLSTQVDRTQVWVSDGFSAVPALQADAILLNPPIRAGKGVVYHLFDEAAWHLVPDGVLWVVIQKKQGADSAKKYLESIFTRVDMAGHQSGYRVYACRGPASKCSK